jgi:hypothetical protein
LAHDLCCLGRLDITRALPEKVEAQRIRARVSHRKSIVQIGDTANFDFNHRKTFDTDEHGESYDFH